MERQGDGAVRDLFRYEIIAPPVTHVEVTGLQVQRTAVSCGLNSLRSQIVHNGIAARPRKTRSQVHHIKEPVNFVHIRRDVMDL